MEVIDNIIGFTAPAEATLLRIAETLGRPVTDFAQPLCETDQTMEMLHLWSRMESVEDRAKALNFIGNLVTATSASQPPIEPVRDNGSVNPFDVVANISLLKRP